MSHDQNFKNLILDYPQESLLFFAQAEIKEDIYQAKITPLRQEQLKERLGERFRELDTALLVEWPNGKREAVIFIIEEDTQSSRFSIHRLAHYCLDIAELFKTNRVVPVVIFLNPGNRPESLRLGSDNFIYAEFNYIACDLKRLSAADYKDSQNIVARLNLPNMQFQSQDKIEIYAAAQMGLMQFEDNVDKQLKYIDFIDYYAELSEDEMIEYKTSQLDKEGNSMRLLDFLKREYVKEGVEQGVQLGEHNKCISIAIRILKRKFAAQSKLDQLIERLPAYPNETLETLAEEAWGFKDIEELDAWLHAYSPSFKG